MERNVLSLFSGTYGKKRARLVGHQDNKILWAIKKITFSTIILDYT
jgi:hypothetical protein